LLDHLAIAETGVAEEYALDVRSVAAALQISPTTLYKYGFNREINGNDSDRTTSAPELQSSRIISRTRLGL